MISGTTTLTTKGQAVIPKSIRDSLGLKTSDQLRFRLEGTKIIGEKIVPLLGLQGTLPEKTSTKLQEKSVTRTRVLQKHTER